MQTVPEARRLPRGRRERWGCAPKGSPGAGDDGQLLDGGGGGDEDAHGGGDQRVAGLVARHNLFLHAHQDAALLLNARHRAQNCMVKIRAAHLACGQAELRTNQSLQHQCTANNHIILMDHQYSMQRAVMMQDGPDAHPELR